MDGGDGENFKRGRHERIDIRVGVERRRKCSREDRLRIVQESLAKGTIIADVARRNEVSPSLIYEWRKQALAGLLDGFHHVRVVPETSGALPAIEAPRDIAAHPKIEAAPPSMPWCPLSEHHQHITTRLRPRAEAWWGLAYAYP